MSAASSPSPARRRPRASVNDGIVRSSSRSRTPTKQEAIFLPPPAPYTEGGALVLGGSLLLQLRASPAGFPTPDGKGPRRRAQHGLHRASPATRPRTRARRLSIWAHAGRASRGPDHPRREGPHHGYAALGGDGRVPFGHGGVAHYDAGHGERSFIVHELREFGGRPPDLCKVYPARLSLVARWRAGAQYERLARGLGARGDGRLGAGSRPRIPGADGDRARVPRRRTLPSSGRPARSSSGRASRRRSTRIETPSDRTGTSLIDNRQN